MLQFIFETETFYTAIYAETKEEALFNALGNYLARKIKENPFMTPCEFQKLQLVRKETLENSEVKTLKI